MKTPQTPYPFTPTYANNVEVAFRDKRSKALIKIVRCCCRCSHINSHNQVRGHRTGSSYSGAEEYPREKHTQPTVVHAYITADAIASPETYKSEIGSQSTMCQVQAGAYVSLLTPGETTYISDHPWT